MTKSNSWPCTRSHRLLGQGLYIRRGFSQALFTGWKEFLRILHRRKSGPQPLVTGKWWCQGFWSPLWVKQVQDSDLLSDSQGFLWLLRLRWGNPELHPCTTVLKPSHKSGPGLHVCSGSDQLIYIFWCYSEFVVKRKLGTRKFATFLLMTATCKWVSLLLFFPLCEREVFILLQPASLPGGLHLVRVTYLWYLPGIEGIWVPLLLTKI